MCSCTKWRLSWQMYQRAKSQYQLFIRRIRQFKDPIDVESFGNVNSEMCDFLTRQRTSGVWNSVEKPAFVANINTFKKCSFAKCLHSSPSLLYLYNLQTGTIGHFGDVTFT